MAKQTVRKISAKKSTIKITPKSGLSKRRSDLAKKQKRAANGRFA